jgi:L-threonylcarbamoyladenylate synthase
MEIIQEKNESVKKIVAVLKKGGVVVCPTDTVYGLLADATNKKAVKKIFKIKKRPKDRSLLVFIGNIKEAKNFAVIDKKQELILKKSWPGRKTFILKAKKGLTDSVYKGATIGIRIPDHDFLNAVLAGIKRPLAQTSANISGENTPGSVKEIIIRFQKEKHKPDLVICAENLKNKRSKPSVIIDLTCKKRKILRR